MEGKVPRCDACSDGIVKPNIVFYGEDLPQRFKDLLEDDFAKCDLLIVMGTSLQVQPFCSLIHRVKQTTPRLLVTTTCVLDVKENDEIHNMYCIFFFHVGGWAKVHWPSCKKCRLVRFSPYFFIFTPSPSPPPPPPPPPIT